MPEWGADIGGKLGASGKRALRRCADGYGDANGHTDTHAIRNDHEHINAHGDHYAYGFPDPNPNGDRDAHIDPNPHRNCDAHLYANAHRNPHTYADYLYSVRRALRYDLRFDV